MQPKSCLSRTCSRRCDIGTARGGILSSQGPEMTRRRLLRMALAIAAAGSAARLARAADKVSKPTGTFEVAMTQAEWEQPLTPAQFSVFRKHGTERPGSSPLD